MNRPTQATWLKRAASVLLATTLGLSACGYGSMTTWEQNSRSSDDSTNPASDESTPSVQPVSDQEMSTPEVCIENPEPDAGPAPARLLTSYEYRNSVRDLVGYDGNITEEFPAENKVQGFENNVSAHSANMLLVRKYMKAAETIARDAVEENLDGILPCNPMEEGEAACGEKFVEDFLERAFRRPPKQGEIDDFVALFEKGRSADGFITGLEMVIEGALQSPQFLYRIQFLEGASDGETQRLDGYELASRLSYLLWASTPDEKLLTAAAEGRLRTRQQVADQARRMLEDPRAKNAVYQFHRQWLKLTELGSMTKDSGQFPEFESEMTDDWRRSMRKFVLDVYFSAGNGVKHLLRSPTIYLTDRLAKLYDRQDMKDESGVDAYQFDPERRSGLLTQPALMALLSNANQNSPIQRGVWVREQLLCETIEPPPGNANLEPPDPDPDATTRERFRQHTEKAACRSCHKLIDPIGFGSENYDGIGRWRSRENGKPVDATGKLANVEDPSIAGEYDGAVELARRLEKSGQVRDCLVNRWFTYALGRSLSGSDKCSLYRVQRAFRNSDGNLREMLVSLASSEAFRYRKVAQKGEE